MAFIRSPQRRLGSLFQSLRSAGRNFMEPFPGKLPNAIRPLFTPAQVDIQVKQLRVSDALRAHSASAGRIYRPGCDPRSAVPRPRHGTSAAESNLSVSEVAACLSPETEASVFSQTLQLLRGRKSITNAGLRENNLVCVYTRTHARVESGACVFCVQQLKATWRPTSTRAVWCRRTFRWPRSCRRKRI